MGCPATHNHAQVAAAWNMAPTMAEARRAVAAITKAREYDVSRYVQWLRCHHPHLHLKRWRAVSIPSIAHARVRRAIATAWSSATHEHEVYRTLSEQLHTSEHDARMLVCAYREHAYAPALTERWQPVATHPIGWV
jgi:hypothetical protein